MLKNSEIDTLTEEQHNALAWLCRVRHELHCSWESVFEGDSDTITPFDNSLGECEINQVLDDAGLKKIDFNFNFDDMPTENDYYNLLTDEEQEEYEQIAEEYNASHSGMQHTGCSVWKEESGEYDIFVKQMGNLNSKIEEYLRNIDKEHNTNYCPSGITRL